MGLSHTIPNLHAPQHPIMARSLQRPQRRKTMLIRHIITDKHNPGPGRQTLNLLPQPIPLSDRDRGVLHHALALTKTTPAAFHGSSTTQQRLSHRGVIKPPHVKHTVIRLVLHKRPRATRLGDQALPGLRYLIQTTLQLG